MKSGTGMAAIRSRFKGMAHSLINTYLWLVSYLPFKILRPLGLRIAGAKVGGNVTIFHGLRTLYPWRLSIGSHTSIARRVILDARGGLIIGENCNISDDVAIWTAAHDLQASNFAMTIAPVVIHARAWLCFRSVILKGVTVGEGAVVATGSVVTKDVPPFSIVAGIPAKVIGHRSHNLTYELGRSRL